MVAAVAAAAPQEAAAVVAWERAAAAAALTLQLHEPGQTSVSWSSTKDVRVPCVEVVSLVGFMPSQCHVRPSAIPNKITHHHAQQSSLARSCSELGSK